MPTVYKTFDRNSIENRNITSTDTATKNAMQNTISNFIVYFKAKHLG